MVTVDSITATLRSRQLPPPAARKAFRLAAGLTLKESAEALGVSVATLVRWEAGLTTPHRANLQKYSQFVSMLREVGK